MSTFLTETPSCVNLVDMTDLPELLGLAELAEMLGMKKDAVVQRVRRGRLPPPDVRLAATPIWKADTIRAWLASEREAG